MTKKGDQKFWWTKHHSFGKKLGFSGKSWIFHEITANCREI